VWGEPGQGRFAGACDRNRLIMLESGKADGVGSFGIENSRGKMSYSDAEVLAATSAMDKYRGRAEG